MAFPITVTKEFNDVTLKEAVHKLMVLIHKHGENSVLLVSTEDVKDDWGYTTRGRILLYTQKKD